MLPRGHIAISVLVSICVWMWFRSLGCAVISFAAGVFIDLDHVLDYYMNLGFTLNLKKMYDACHQMRLLRLYLVLHSYELLMLLWGSIFIFSLSHYWIALAIGLTQHMIVDQITNPIKRFGYFLSYRILRKFKREHVVYSRQEGAHGNIAR